MTRTDLACHVESIFVQTLPKKSQISSTGANLCNDFPLSVLNHELAGSHICEHTAMFQLLYRGRTKSDRQQDVRHL